jgi:phospholipid transport system substrate-binding protein
MKLLHKLLLAASLVIAAPGFAASSPAQEAPDVLARRITQEVIDTARNDKEIRAGNRKRIQALVESHVLPHVDFQRATALTVGRFWREATPQQQQQLIDEFRALMIHTYSGALSQIGDQKLAFLPLRGTPDDNEAEVRFQVRQQRGETINVSYRLYKGADGWKVYDVNLLGAWLIETYKGNFSAEIGRGGIDGLIRTLSEKNRKLAAQPGSAARAS